MARKAIFTLLLSVLSLLISCGQHTAPPPQTPRPFARSLRPPSHNSSPPNMPARWLRGWNPCWPFRWAEKFKRAKSMWAARSKRPGAHEFG